MGSIHITNVGVMLKFNYSLSIFNMEMLQGFRTEQYMCFFLVCLFFVLPIILYCIKQWTFVLSKMVHQGRSPKRLNLRVHPSIVAKMPNMF